MTGRGGQGLDGINNLFTESLEGSSLGRSGEFIPALMELFAGMAGRHADELDWGVESLNRQGLTWMLSGISFRLFRPPQDREELRAETWPSGVRKLFALRDFIVRDSRGEAVADGYSTWLLIDTARRRPVRAERIVAGLEFSPSRGGYDFSSLTVPHEEGAVIERYTAGRQHLDFNDHVTAPIYLEWLFKQLEQVKGAGASPRYCTAEYAVQYRREIRLGQSAKALTGPIDAADGSFRQAVVDAETGEAFAVAKGVLRDL